MDSVLEGVYSINAGQTWNPLFGEPGSGLPVSPILLDPNTHMPTVPYLEASNPTLAFDRSENFYVVESQHNSGGSSGSIVMMKFNFAGDSPTAAIITTPQNGTVPYRVLYQWLPADDFAIDPTVQVDSNLPSFVEIRRQGTRRDRSRFGQRVCKLGGGCRPTGWKSAGAAFNPNPIYLTISSDGGKTFSTLGLMNTSTTTTLWSPTASVTTCRRSWSARAGYPMKAEFPGMSGVPGGEVTATWNNSGTNENEIMTNTVAPGHAYQFTGPGGDINPGTKTAPTITSFPETISIPASDLNAWTISL